MKPPFGPDDPAFPEWLAAVKSAFKDMDAAARDRFRRRRDRDLGHRQHVKLYKGASKQLKKLLALAERDEPSEPGDPTH